MIYNSGGGNMQHTVYIKTDSSNRITEINSSAFISDFSGWIEVDKGDGG